MDHRPIPAAEVVSRDGCLMSRGVITTCLVYKPAWQRSALGL